MITPIESRSKTMATLVAGGELAIVTNSLGFDVLVCPKLGVVTLQSKMRGKTWDDEELICKAAECLSLVDDRIHDLECYDEDEED